MTTDDERREAEARDALVGAYKILYDAMRVQHPAAFNWDAIAPKRYFHDQLLAAYRTAILRGPLAETLREVIAELHHVHHTQRYAWEECTVMPCVKVRPILQADAQQSADARREEA